MWNLNTVLRRVHLTPPSLFTVEGRKRANWNECQPSQVITQFEGYVKLLQRLDVEVYLGEPAPVDNPDAIYSYDSCMCIPAGAIVLQSIKENRQFEIEIVRRDLKNYQVPIIGQILHPCHIDGGDILWLNKDEVAVGRSWRTNDRAIDKLRAILSAFAIQVRSYDLSNLLGKEHCLHLMSVVSMLDSKTALIYEKGMPIALLRRLDQLGIRTLSIAEEEWCTLGCNVLSLGKGKVIAVDGNPKTKKIMEGSGFSVFTFQGSSLCLAGEGGPTCLTRFLSAAMTIT